MSRLPCACVLFSTVLSSYCENRQPATEKKLPTLRVDHWELSTSILPQPYYAFGVGPPSAGLSSSATSLLPLASAGIMGRSWVGADRIAYALNPIQIRIAHGTMTLKPTISVMTMTARICRLRLRLVRTYDPMPLSLGRTASAPARGTMTWAVGNS